MTLATPNRWVRACALAELAEDTALAVEIDGTEVAVVRSGDAYYAIADLCSHASIPLSDGEVVDGTIECFLHSSLFDLRTGRPLGLPATEPVPVYRTQVDGDDLLVDVSAPYQPERASSNTQES
ncbi:non-heme iron oxygenase ferredoxin subunit [uncultured Friedmanniella sp.]|uniref:non-heme iron oxygenase ferredoxin subunit n=1 Tax=uncultured Friedmanniella sp. TaxID=335381 RepID=UPI0035CBB7B2